jgi:hypothetical protein
MPVLPQGSMKKKLHSGEWRNSYISVRPTVAYWGKVVNYCNALLLNKISKVLLIAVTPIEF